MIETLIFLPVASKDAIRVGYAVRSIRQYCDAHRIYLLLDGVNAASLPADIMGNDVRICTPSQPSKGNWGKIWLLQARSMIEANQADDIAPNAVFVRMDSDAIVIRQGFTARAQRIFSTRPKAGQIGQTFSNIRGARFHNAGWTNYLRKIMGPRGVAQFIQSAVREKRGIFAGLKAHKDFRAIVNRSTKNGYVLGDVCLGGFNIIRRDLIVAMTKEVSLDDTPFQFLPILGDDIVMTLYTYWLGYAPIDDSSDDGICGIEAAGFRMDPFVLKKRGHYALHPLKYGYHDNGYDLDESELVKELTSS